MTQVLEKIWRFGKRLIRNVFVNKNNSYDENAFGNDRTVHIDQCLGFSDGGVLISGWTQDAANCDFWIVQDADHILDIDIKSFFARDDARVYLDEKNKNSEGIHGFILFCSSTTPRNRYQILRKTSQDEALSKVFTLEQSQTTLRQGLFKIFSVFSQSERLSFDNLDRLLSIAQSRSNTNTKKKSPEISKDIWLRHNPEENIQLSIIVPFYADSYFILDHIDSQTRSLPGTEWIFVCDDPSIEKDLTQTLQRRVSLLTQDTRLLTLKANYGYAQANNIGARHARGQFLLLMNSDVFCKTFDPFRYGMNLLNDCPEIGPVGFSLKFEDETIQHEGACFEKDLSFNNLWIYTHPRKGLPANWDEINHEYVEGTTGALMLLKKSDYENGKIFSDDYIKGDFEDADVCLQAHKLDKKIALIKTSGLYHFERQSIKHLSDLDARYCLTYINCALLNNKWGNLIETIVHNRKNPGTELR